MVVIAMSASVVVRAQVTFYDDIQFIFAEHCLRCHYPDGVAPMPLVTFEQARPWARSIEQEVLARRMPPWFADPRVGEFQNDARLSERERSAILKWVELGARAGKRSAATPPPVRQGEWEIGEPDLIVEMPEPFLV